MAFAVYRKSKNKDLRGILISPFFYSKKEAEEFAKNKRGVYINKVNCNFLFKKKKEGKIYE